MNQTSLQEEGKPTEKEDVTKLLADLLFAYINKDSHVPDSSEMEAVENAVAYLEKEYKGSLYSPEFFSVARN